MINAPQDWDPALEVGDRIIDGQHRSLFGMIMGLDARMTQEEFGLAVLDALQGMRTYAATHFEDEERMMEQAGWPGLPEHRKMHGEFMRRASLFSAETLADSEWTALEMLRFLMRWLIEHIKVQDKGFFEWRKLRSGWPD